MAWDPSRDIGDLSGKIAVVTGGNTGIGKEIVRQLALHDAKVYMASRTESRARDAIRELKEAHQGLQKGDNIKYLKLDLTDLRGCKQAAMRFLEMEERLDILINNAGIMATPYELTKDGLEIQFQSNHLGHFVFTLTLLPLFVQTSKDPHTGTSVRICNVSSYGHTMAPKDIKFDSIESVNREFSPMGRYGQSKLANILFTKELTRRLKDERIFVSASHPGAVRTELNRGMNKSYPIFRPLLWFLSLFFKTPYQGATTVLYTACSGDVERNNWRGEYYVPVAKRAEASDLAQSAKLAKDLWEFSERVVQEKVGSLPVSPELE